jgi:transcriptional regulator with XRE-family HTH domain
MKSMTEYERFEASSPENRRLLGQEELIIQATESIFEMMEQRNVSRSELARRLGKTPGYVTHILSGGRNMTLRTIADVADALQVRPRMILAEPVCPVGTMKHIVAAPEWQENPQWLYPELEDLEQVGDLVGAA